MRLLSSNTDGSFSLTCFTSNKIPSYAILSHTWGPDDQEVTFHDMINHIGQSKKGYRKIQLTAEQAISHGLRYFWVDCCCIDKSSSAELSEAINSMFIWYQRSNICYVYLEDIQYLPTSKEGSGWPTHIQHARWFTRGWTLQELIAPRSMEFYDLDWNRIGNKEALAQQLCDITGISESVLLGTRHIRAFSLAMIMSWASSRVTTRDEDIAYCLLGLFNINMPLLYGEGQRAFVRLQEEIMKQFADQSLFAWNPPSIEPVRHTSSGDNLHCGIFAPSPACFAETKDVTPSPAFWNTESILTNRGVRLCMPIKYDVTNQVFLGILCCVLSSSIQDVAIELQSPSNVLEDNEHLIRYSTRLRYGNWSNDQQVLFRNVYLATDASLAHTKYFGSHFMNTEFEIHILLDDPGQLVTSRECVTVYPPGALTDRLDVNFKTAITMERVAVLNPMKTEHKTIALSLSTSLSQDIALIFGFHVSQNGLPSGKSLWKTIAAVAKDAPLKEIHQDTLKLRHNGAQEVLVVPIDWTEVKIEIGQQPWFTKISMCLLISVTSDTEEILPFLEKAEEPFGEVYEVKIHPSHHNFKPLNYENSSVFVVKQLLSEIDHELPLLTELRSGEPFTSSLANKEEMMEEID